ncbi:MAG TPA: YtxH domain-containing protein [Puia sp.]|nr:YtxH domain-containing protein [Puia sp.]
MNTKRIFGGLLAGIAAGAILSLLFTDKGKKVRKKMFRKGTDVAENLKNKFSEFIDSVDEKIQTAKK